MRRTFIKLLILPGVLLLPSQLYSQDRNTEEVSLSDESNLSINGTSNVTDFSCGLEQHLSQEKLSFSYQFEQNRVLVDGNTLYINAEQFDCGKRGINRDFKKALKVKEYPYIKITLKELIVTDAQSFPTEALVNIEIAGVVREYMISLVEIESFSNSVRVRGEKSLNITDFNLSPPTALFGMVKVRDELSIDFNLIISQN